MARFSLLIFDLDGTLVDSQNDLRSAVNYVRKAHNRPPASPETVRSHIGDGVKSLIERSLPGLEGESLEAALKMFRRFYGEHLLDTTTVYPGIREVLAGAGNRTKAVLTNKTESFAKQLLKGLDLYGYFDLVWGGNTGVTKKPDPGPVMEIMKRLRHRRETTAIIGDGVNDIRAAKSAGVVSIAAGYGYTDRKTLMSLAPDYYVTGVKQLGALLDKEETACCG